MTYSLFQDGLFTGLTICADGQFLSMWVLSQGGPYLPQNIVFRLQRQMSQPGNQETRWKLYRFLWICLKRHICHHTIVIILASVKGRKYWLYLLMRGGQSLIVWIAYVMGDVVMIILSLCASIYFKSVLLGEDTLLESGENSPYPLVL